MAQPCPSSQVSHKTQEAGVGGGDTSFARWGWGPDLSGEPGMNQPDHSRPIWGDGTHEFSSSSPSNVPFPFLSLPQTQALVGVCLQGSG